MSHGDRQTHSTKNNTVTSEMGHCKVAAPLPTRPTAHTLFSVVSNTHKTIPLKKTKNKNRQCCLMQKIPCVQTASTCSPCGTYQVSA